MSATLASRCARKSLLSKVMTPSEAAHKFFETGMTVGFSGFTPAGYPKVVPIALADRVEKEGVKLQFELFAGSSIGVEIEDRWAKLGMESRYSFC